MATTLLAAALPDVYANLTEGDFVWVLVGICLVFFMQAGFAMVETGNAGGVPVEQAVPGAPPLRPHFGHTAPVKSAVPPTRRPPQNADRRHFLQKHLQNVCIFLNL